MDPYWHHVSYRDVYDHLDTCETGLTEEETLPRVDKYGLNELEEEEGFSVLELLLEPFQDFIIILLMIGLVISALLGDERSAIGIAVAIAINVTVSFIQEYRAEKAIKALKQLGALQAKVIRGNEERIIPARDLVPGDVVVLEVGSKVPADIRLTEVHNLYIDESTLTGESLPVEKNTSAISEDTQLSEQSNMAFSSTVVTAGRGKGVVVATGRNTQIGTIADLVREAEEEQTPLQERLDDLGKQIGWFGISVCILFFLIGTLTKDPSKALAVHVVDMFLTAVALGVAVVPEGLAAVVTITLAIGLTRLARVNGIIRKLPAVETLGCATVICSDKTGTLTKNEITVRELYVNDRLIQLEHTNKKPDVDEHLSLLLRSASLCNNANRSEGGIIGDPLEGALIMMSDDLGVDHRSIRTASPRVHEVPFDPKNKYMATIHTTLDGQIAYVKGAPETIIGLCNKEFSQGNEHKLTDHRRTEFLETCHDMARRGLRVFGFAYQRTAGDVCSYKPSKLVFIGLMGMMDPPREEAIDAVEICKEAGVRVVMITGDHKLTAEAIDKEMGILGDDHLVLEGREIDDMDDDELNCIVEQATVFARATPEHKTRIVKALKENGHVTAMTGDGVNDAPALKNASIGIAMGMKGTDVAKEASDMILADDNFATIVKAVKEGRTIYANIKKFLRFQLTTNVSAIVTVFFIPLLKLPIDTFEAIHLLWINLIMDGPPALALGAEPAPLDIMTKKPRDPDEDVLTKRMLATIVVTGLYRAIATIFTLWWFLQSDPSPAGQVRAKTMAFTTFILFQFFNCFNCKSEKSIMEMNLLSNIYLYMAVFGSFFLQVVIVHHPPVAAFFNVAPMPLSDWLLAFSIAFSGVLVEEMRKAHDRYVQQSEERQIPEVLA